MAVAVWAREASPGGSVCVSDRGQARLRRARRLSGLGRRGVKKPAAAAKQRGAEMNETYGTSTSGLGGISWDIPGYASLWFLSLLIPGYASLEILTRLIPTYPGISYVLNLVLGYPAISRLPQGVVFPDVVHNIRYNTCTILCTI